MLVWYHRLSFLYTIWVSVRRIFFFLIPVGFAYWTASVFSIPFGPIYHARTSTARLNCPSINMLENENGFDLSNSSGIQSYSHLDIPTKYQYLTNATILIPMGKLLDTIVDIEYWYHAFTYTLAHHWYWLFYFNILLRIDYCTVRIVYTKTRGQSPKVCNQAIRQLFLSQATNHQSAQKLSPQPTFMKLSRWFLNSYIILNEKTWRTSSVLHYELMMYNHWSAAWFKAIFSHFRVALSKQDVDFKCQKINCHPVFNL